MADRTVRFHPAFFDDLDAQLPAARSTSGRPSVTDFLLHDLPRLRDLLARDVVANTIGSAELGAVRVLVQAGTLVGSVALYAAESGDDVVVLGVEIDVGDPPQSG